MVQYGVIPLMSIRTQAYFTFDLSKSQLVIDNLGILLQVPQGFRVAAGIPEHHVLIQEHFTVLIVSLGR